MTQQLGTETHLFRRLMQGQRGFKASEMETMGEVPLPKPRSLKLWVKPAVRWAFMSAAACIVALSMLRHAAAQLAQQAQEAAHARCCQNPSTPYLLIV